MHVLAPTEFHARDAVILFSRGPIWTEAVAVVLFIGTRECDEEEGTHIHRTKERSRVFRVPSNENRIQRGGDYAR